MHPLQPLIIQEFLGKTWKQVEKPPLIKYAESPEGEAGDNQKYITGPRGKSLQRDSVEKSKGCRLHRQSTGRVILLKDTSGHAAAGPLSSEDDSSWSKLPREIMGCSIPP